MSAETNLDTGVREDSSSVELREKIRTEGLNTVSKLLHDARHENKLLKEKTTHLERSLEAANAKLQKAGLVDASKSGPPDEKPLPSKNLVEGLIKENARLKQQIEHPHKVDELSLHVYSLQGQIKSLKREREHLQSKLDSIEDSLRLSPDAKDQQIRELAGQVKDTRHKYQQEYDRNQVLSHEIAQLREHLHETARHCLNVSNRLQTTTTVTVSRSDSESASRPVVKASSAGGQAGAGDRNSLLEDKCGRLEQELEMTRNQLKHLVLKTNSARTSDKPVGFESLQKQLNEKEREIQSLVDRQKILEHQLHVYQDDFARERADKELALKQNSDLRLQLRESQGAPSGQTAGQSSNAWDSRHAARTSAARGVQKQSSARPPARQVSGGVQPDSTDDNISLSSQTEVLRPTRPEGVRPGQLACFKCGKRYTAETHGQLVEHLGECTGGQR